MKKNLLIFLVVLGLLSGCGIVDNSHDNEETMQEELSKNDEDMFTERDGKTDYDESEAITINLNGTTATSNSDSVAISGSKITITQEATYVVTGELTDGMLIVDAPDTAKLQIVLKGANITSKTSAALYILGADKVFVTLAGGTSNMLVNGGSFTAIDDNNIDGALFSKQDLTLNGNGSLTITSPAGHGIVCKDDLVITSGTYVVNSASHGLDANDSIRIAMGDITINAGKDALHAENADEDSKGYIYISGGRYMISSGDDAIHAEETLTVVDGSIEISESYEGLEALHIDVQGGEIKILSSDDGLNAAGGVDQSGTFGGQDGMHGGHGGMGGGKPGGKPGDMGGMSSNSNGSVKISGGTLYINSSGDGIDANGTLEISGGHITVVGPTFGDTATLDYDKSGIITGGTFIGTGAYGMAQTFSDSEQGVISVSVGNQCAGTNIFLEDKNGKTIIEYTPELDFAVVILSSPEIIKGESYIIKVGSESGEFIAN